jgi:hypothetical protein
MKLRAINIHAVDIKRIVCGFPIFCRRAQAAADIEKSFGRMQLGSTSNKRTQALLCHYWICCSVLPESKVEHVSARGELHDWRQCVVQLDDITRTAPESPEQEPQWVY